ncbi:hypothetical protein [Paraburkholderia eburnea]|nr:hypothetical protein [Paraburkholderia eburnea]
MALSVFVWAAGLLDAIFLAILIPIVVREVVHEKAPQDALTGFSA